MYLDNTRRPPTQHVYYSIPLLAQLDEERMSSRRNEISLVQTSWAKMCTIPLLGGVRTLNRATSQIRGAEVSIVDGDRQIEVFPGLSIEDGS